MLWCSFALTKQNIHVGQLGILAEDFLLYGLNYFGRVMYENEVYRTHILN